MKLLTFKSSLEQLLAELERIEILLRVQISESQQLQEADKAFRGLYISDQEVELLLDKPLGSPRWAIGWGETSWFGIKAPFERLGENIQERTRKSLKEGTALRLETLRQIFHLDQFEIDVLLICLAPELDLRYERLFSYLQDDVTKKRPSVDLVLSLLCPSLAEKMKGRQYFNREASLLRHQLIQIFDDPVHLHPPLLSQFLKIDVRIGNFLLEVDELDSRLGPYAKSVCPQVEWKDCSLPLGVKKRLIQLCDVRKPESQKPILYFQGREGVGKQRAAEALCREGKVDLFVVDTETLVKSTEAEFESLVTLCMREALLRNAAMYWSNIDSVQGEEKKAQRKILQRLLPKHPGLVFLGGRSHWELWASLPNRMCVPIEFQFPTCEERQQLWEKSMNGHLPSKIGSSVPHDMANAFQLTARQIQDATTTAYNLAYGRNPDRPKVTSEDVYAACRLHSNRNLSALAQKVKPKSIWGDIVLPPDRLQQLQEICDHMKYRNVVYDRWGFDRKLSLGKGLSILFAGPSGAGKTMASEVIANELGLDLYKIDLSSVVSKYIGETEKNLDRIFREAQSLQAILFFDEADALFGKRSEVKDAHDRYANIEIGYLLQKMEEHEGIIILATNLQQNMDQAFVRRIQVSIEFPFPDEQHRRKIWDRVFPEEMPIAPDVDLGFLAKHFKLTGGHIKNIAVTSAFMAAVDGTSLTMPNLIQATKREYQKLGWLCSKADFGPFYSLVEELA